jgi:hypothetical protein
MKNLLLTSCLAITSLVGFSQTARVQVIHNSADPAAKFVDVYLDGALLLNDFKFRTATPYIDAPAGTPITISIAPSTSVSVDDAIANFTYTLTEGDKYVVVANGVLDPGAFAANPDGVSTAFNLFVRNEMREEALDAANLDFVFFHGSTDAPTVDAIARGVATVVDNAAYTAFTDYVSVPADKYIIDVTPGDVPSLIVASARAFLDGAGGASAVIFASGFFDTALNPGGKSLKLFYALPDGTVQQLPLITTAKLQVIHNAADPAAAVVDIYVDGALALDNFSFRTATPYIDVPGNVPVSIAVAPPTSESVDDAIATISATFKAGYGYIAMATGVLNPVLFNPNPDGASIAFNLLVKENTEFVSDRANGLEFFGVHGCTDAPTVDIIARDVATLLDNVSYGAVSDYQVVPANTTYILDVALGDAPEVVVASYEASLAAVAGQSAVVYASGFLSPELNPEGSLPFGLYYTLADGTTGAFPVYVMRQAAENTIATVIYPNPANANVNITLPAEFNGNIQITDLNGKIVKSVTTTTSTSETLSLNIENLAAGIYTVTTTSANAISATKLIVE